MIKFEKEKVEIHVKGGFSERKGIKKFSEIVQVTSLNTRTRNKIYDAIIHLFHIGGGVGERIITYLYTEILSCSSFDIPKITYYNTINFSKVEMFIRDVITSIEYNEIFDFIDGIIKFDWQQSYRIKNNFINAINTIFTDENVNYKIVNDIVTDILDDEQIKSVEQTLNNPYKVVATHYDKAIELLYKTKDYDNSIKESISSVEAMCQVITGKSNATLGDALKILKNDIHSAMKSAFEKLYGYTSDANGIRHSNGLGEGNSTFEEAKYMLISCSAFVNYLKENFEEGKLI